MGFQSGTNTISGGTATPLMAPRAASAVTVQNLGTASVTIGGPGLTWGQGLVLASGALPVAIQATHFGNVEDADDQLYAITQAAGSGNAIVGWVHGF